MFPLNFIENQCRFSSSLLGIHYSSPVAIKEKIQKTIFPQGIVYNFKIGTFLTSEINPVFECIALLAQVSEDPKNKQGSISAALSCLVGRVGHNSNISPYNDLPLSILGI